MREAVPPEASIPQATPYLGVKPIEAVGMIQPSAVLCKGLSLWKDDLGLGW